VGTAGAVDEDEISGLVRAVAAVRGERTLATAESCTAGAVANALARGDGASDWLRGGVVAYHREVKYDVLGVPRGPVVNHTAARAMATGVARLLGADAAVSVTGAAGPDGMDGQPAGTVFVGYWCDGVVTSVEHHFDGEPAEVCDAATRAALAGLADRLQSSAVPAD
jgi:nicotinamide-nucleotide amidase